MTYSEWMDKLSHKSEDKLIPDGSVYCHIGNSNLYGIDGTWIANKDGTRVLFLDGFQILSLSPEHDEKWLKKKQSVSKTVNKVLNDFAVLAEAEDITVSYYNDYLEKRIAHEAVKLTRPTAEYDESISTYVYKKLLKGFPKNAMFYTDGPLDPVLVCLPEDKKCRGRILPIAIVFPFDIRFYTNREEN